MRYPFATIALLLVTASARATVYTNAWSVDLPRNPPAVIDLWRGETVALCARTGITNLPASAEFLWQSPSMGTSWYTTNATATVSGDVTTVWRPEMDSGAASYSFFFRVGSGDLYRPRGTIKMQGSPGAVPNEIPIPPRVLDFATVTVLNAPWTTEADVLELLSDIGGGGVIEETDPVAMPALISHVGQRDNPHGVTAAQVGALGMSWPSTGTVYHATAAGSGSTWVTARDGSGWLLASGRAEGVAGDYDAIIVSEVFGEGYNGPDPGTVLMLSPSGAYTSGVWSIELTPPYGVYLSHAEPDRITWYAEGSIPDAASVELSPDVEDAIGTVSIAWYGTTEVEERLATESDVAGATNAVVASIFSLTNALLVVSNEVATIETNGVPIWTSAGGSGSVPPSVTNELWQSIAGLQGTVSALQGTVAALSHAWGEYAPDGSPNPDPDYMLWINRPATVWGAGFQWAVSGGHAVLTATGTVAFAAGGSGEMRIGPGDGTNYFGFVTGGSVEVGASASGITVADEVATIVYPYDSGDFPTLWFTPDLATPFETMDGVVWVDNEDGTATASAPATTERGFWRATTSATYAAEFTSTMPARLAGGVWGATNATPVVYDSVINISSGGKTYRIPAEEL